MASWPPPSHQKMQLQAGGHDRFTDPILVNSILTTYRLILVSYIRMLSCH